MQTELSPSWRETPSHRIPPHCVFVTGSCGAGKTRWLQSHSKNLLERSPAMRCAVPLAEEGRTRLQRLALDTPGVMVRMLLLPCPCCPALADLPVALRALVVAVYLDWIFVEVPTIAAANLVAEFDHSLGWQRELVVCLDRTLATARREHGLSPFQMVLVELADRLVSNPAAGGTHCDTAAPQSSRHHVAALVLT